MKTAMIWGAGGGIGRGLLARLAEQDWTVLAVTHRPTNFNGSAAHVIEADVSNPYEVETAVATASQLVTEVDLWIYAVGDITAAKAKVLSPQAWQRILSANLTGAFLATHYSLPLLAPEAHLVYLGAISERLQLPGLTAYAAAKSGLEAFATALGKEERQRRVTVVRPGAVKTDLWAKVPMNLPANAFSPEDLADRILGAYEAGHQGLLDLPKP